MEPILKENDGETRYEVFYDNDDFHDCFEGKSRIDFESEKDKQEYMNKFSTGELSAFGVVELYICPCCCMWSEKESCWGIHAETPELALKLFKLNL